MQGNSMGRQQVDEGFIDQRACAEVAEPPRQVRLLPEAAKAITGAMHAASPQEGCGLLGGYRDLDTVIAAYLPLANQHPTADGFAVDPVMFLRASADLERRGLAVVGFVHSHPNGTTAPSERDCASAWRHTVQLIAAPTADGRCPISAFWFADGRFARIPLVTSE